MSPVPVIDDHDKRSGSGTGILLLRTSIFSLVMTPYVPLVCVLLLVMQSYGLFSVLLHTGICNTLQVISKFRETLSMDKTMWTHDIYNDPRSDGHFSTRSLFLSTWCVEYHRILISTSFWTTSPVLPSLVTHLLWSRYCFFHGFYGIRSVNPCVFQGSPMTSSGFRSDDHLWYTTSVFLFLQVFLLWTILSGYSVVVILHIHNRIALDMISQPVHTCLHISSIKKPTVFVSELPDGCHLFSVGNIFFLLHPVLWSSSYLVSSSSSTQNTGMSSSQSYNHFFRWL